MKKDYSWGVGVWGGRMGFLSSFGCVYEAHPSLLIRRLSVGLIAGRGVLLCGPRALGYSVLTPSSGLTEIHHGYPTMQWGVVVVRWTASV